MYIPPNLLPSFDIFGKIFLKGLKEGRNLGKIKKLSLSTKFTIITISLLAIFSILISFIIKTVVTDSIKEMATEKAKGDLKLGYELLDEKYPGNWHKSGDKLYKGDVLVSGNEEMVDYIGELTKDTVTIFLGDTRVTTNVIKDGERAVGTQASPEVTEQTLRQGKNYYGEANVVGNNYQTAYQTIKDEQGEIIGMWYVGAPVDLVDEALHHLNIVLFSSLAILVLLAFAVTIPFTNRMKKRLGLLGDALERAGHGDLTAEIADAGADEISSLANSYGKMRENLVQLVMKMRETAETVAASAEEMSAGAEETAKATESIADSVQEMASSAEDQVTHTDRLNETVKQISDGIKQITYNTGEVQKATEENSQAAQNGATVIEKTRNQVVLIHEMTQSTADFINQLNVKSKEIGNIINMITAISEQTNLLALNAAIEAARAGEHGKGFAVVASEVRKLAEQSSQSAIQIQELISSIQKDITHSVESMESGKTAIGHGLELAEEAEQSFKRISHSVLSVNEQIGSVSTSVRDINRGTEDMVHLLEEIVYKIQQSSDATQSAASATEEQSASMEEIHAFSQSLSHLAEELRSSINAFKL